MTRLISMAMAVLLLTAASAGAQSVAKPQKYLFYLHGSYVEESGPYIVNRIYNTRYEVDNIERAFSNKGFFVISEYRPRGADAPTYADKLADEVSNLLESGVQPSDITIVGHSKGGLIAMMAAARLQIPEINYALMAACSRSLRRGGYTQFVSRESQKMAGRILLITERRNTEAGSCREALMRAKSNVTSEERFLDTGKGDGLFYKPEPAWVDLIDAWAKPLS